MVDVFCIKNGEYINNRGKGLYEKIENNKFKITAEFHKKGIYEIKIFMGESSCKQIKFFHVLCKHDFSKDKIIEKKNDIIKEVKKEEIKKDEKTKIVNEIKKEEKKEEKVENKEKLEIENLKKMD